MNVLFQTRINYLTNPGGDTIQLLNTKNYLEKIGVSVTIDNAPNVNLHPYDLVHIFNIIRPLDFYIYMRNVKQQGKKMAVSSIYWDLTNFRNEGTRANIEKSLQKILGFWGVEKLKCVLRTDRPFNQIFHLLLPLSLAKYGEILQGVDIFLPNSMIEAELLDNEFGYKFNHRVVHNAVNRDYFNLKKAKNNRHGFISVTRADPRKNLKLLLSTFKENKLKLDVYCSKSPMHKSYFKKLNTNSIENIAIKHPVSNELLGGIYGNYFAHVLPSWAETPGLVQLEAAACGCNIISTSSGSAPEYFADMAKYCDPALQSSLQAAIHLSINDPVSPAKISDFILSKYSWEKTAQQTLAAYDSLFK